LKAENARVPAWRAVDDGIWWDDGVCWIVRPNLLDREAIDKLLARNSLSREQTASSMTPEDPQNKPDASQGAPAAAGASDTQAGSAQSAVGGDAAAKAAESPPTVKPIAAAGAPAAAKAAAPPPPPPKPQPVDEFDPLGWDVPIICKDCDKPFVVPYRNFLAGVVFHCPLCQGSWVPNTTIAKEMRQVFEVFWGSRKRTREAFERGELKLDRAAFERRQTDELKAFKKRLEQLATKLKPAGKLVRPKGLAAMFT
jgi:Zn-finger nucleic acid-binding protein